MQLRTHDITLHGDNIMLRPLTGERWPLLERWSADPAILHFTEGPGTRPYDAKLVRQIYATVSQAAFCFIIELDGRPIGDCWLQEMNLERLQEPGRDVRRIDLLIGEKELWGRGYGSEVIRLLTRFAFDDQRADVVYAAGVADYNPRSRRAFEKRGYVLAHTHREQASDGAGYETYDLRIERPVS